MYSSNYELNLVLAINCCTTSTLYNWTFSRFQMTYKNYFSDGILSGCSERIEALRPKSPPPKNRERGRGRGGRGGRGGVDRRGRWSTISQRWAFFRIADCFN